MAKAAKDSEAARPLGAHGALRLPRVEIDSYNIEIKDENGFIGDAVSKKSLNALIDKWREPLAKSGKDPFDGRKSAEITRKELDAVLADGDAESGGLVHAVIDDFAQSLAGVVRRYLRDKAWAGTERIVVGGGLRVHRIGELAIGAAALLLKAEDIAMDMVPIQNDPDDAGLLGAVQLAPSWLFKGHDAILGVDIGGTNMRAGIVALNLKKANDLSKAEVLEREIWRHASEKPKRDEAVEALTDMLRKLIRRAERDGVRLAPFIGIGCPGKIEADGAIDRGAQNLPGNWESSRFNLPQQVLKAIPEIATHETLVVVHNDAVVQGLSEVPFMADVERWGVLTIGTGLGNARFTNRTRTDSA